MSKLSNFFAVAAVFLAPLSAMAQSSLPNPMTTPGAINPQVTQENISSTICVRGWTRTVRPDESYTENLKRYQIRQYGYADRSMRDYEEDHLIPLELGGAPSNSQNLWPQPRYAADGWTSDKKDHLENVLNKMVCSGRLGLDDARRAIARDWRSAYQRYVAE
jgi:hypothetical protein